MEAQYGNHNSTAATSRRPTLPDDCWFRSVPTSTMAFPYQRRLAAAAAVAAVFPTGPVLESIAATVSVTNFLVPPFVDATRRSVRHEPL